MELHLSFLRLQGQANDFKIQYSSVVRLFLLPKVFYSCSAHKFYVDANEVFMHTIQFFMHVYHY